MISAIVLAAGRSRRMGTQKMLLPFGGRTVIGHVVAEVLRSSVDQVIVVAGLDAVGTAAALTGQHVRIVTNPDPDGDMLSSVRCGLRTVPPACAAILVVLGDQPAVRATLVDRMLDAFHTCGRGILVPVHGNRSGHPILISTRYREEILTSHGDVGLRGLRQAHPDDVFDLDVPDPAVLSDMDCPEDYRRELARLAATAAGPEVESTGASVSSA